jgi:peptide/nickel transport system substrate-binding protein
MAARRLLEDEGWYDSDGDGIIDKEINGQRVPFRFTISYYVKNSLTKAVAESIVTMLREVGIVCELRGLDVADLTREEEDKSFDALMMAWVLGTPPDDPRQLWHSEGAREKGSSNIVSFANAEADKIIEELAYTYDPKERIVLYHRFDTILHDEQPYTFLYSPKTTLLYRSYLQNVFIPAERQDLVPGANVAEPQSSIFWLKKQAS